MVRKLLSSLLIILLIVAGFPVRISYAQQQKFYTIAALDLVANGISEAEAKSLSEYMRGQITRAATSDEFSRKSGFSYKVIERSQMDKILDEMQFQGTGCTDEECAVEVGKVLGVERIIIGSVGLVGETYTINTRIIDIETANT
ncbi:CsgG/HfaB family protein, partial [bacterium]|nr:CsgG/HfaB family protein [bacterium]